MDLACNRRKLDCRRRFVYSRERNISAARSRFERARDASGDWD